MSKKRLYMISIVVLLVIFLAIEVLNIFFANDTNEYELIYGIATRGIGAAICILMMAYCSFTYLFSSFGKFSWKYNKCEETLPLLA